jgi:hypothetical protein
MSAISRGLTLHHPIYRLLCQVSSAGFKCRSLYLLSILHSGYFFSMMRLLSCRVRSAVPSNIHLTNEDGAANGHGDCNDWKIHTRKVETPDSYVLSSEDIPPQETSQ